MVKNKVAQRAIAAGLAGVMSFSAMAPAALAVDWDESELFWRTNWLALIDTDEGLDWWARMGGDTRYDTMKRIVDATYRNSNGSIYGRTQGYYGLATTAVLASGDNFPDALAANGLAGYLNGGDGAPVILTKAGKLSSQAKTLLDKMQVQTLYIMGGEAAVSAEVENEVKSMNIATIRVAGADRQATSLAAAKLIDGNWFKNHDVNSVIIASGKNYADALSISPYAYQTGSPIILTKADGTLTDEAASWIKDNPEFTRVVIVGGKEAVSDTVLGQIGTTNSKGKFNYDFTRIAGANRYETSAKIAEWEVSADCIGLFSWDWLFVATGENFPDALAGGQLAGGSFNFIQRDAGKTRDNHRLGSPILLTKDGDTNADSVLYQALLTDWYSNFQQTTNLTGLRWYTARNYTTNWDYFENTFLAADGFGQVWTTSQNWFGDYTPFTDTVNLLNSAGFTRGLNHNYMFSFLDENVSVSDNFHGIILGGRDAVSKDRADDLDDLVDWALGRNLTNANYTWNEYVKYYNDIARTYNLGNGLSTRETGIGVISSALASMLPVNFGSLLNYSASNLTYANSNTLFNDDLDICLDGQGIVSSTATTVTVEYDVYSYGVWSNGTGGLNYNPNNSWNYLGTVQVTYNATNDSIGFTAVSWPL